MSVSEVDHGKKGDYNDDASKRLKVSITAALYLFNFCSGLSTASIGTTMVHMGYRYHTNIQVLNPI